MQNIFETILKIFIAKTAKEGSMKLQHFEFSFIKDMNGLHIKD